MRIVAALGGYVLAPQGAPTPIDVKRSSAQRVARVLAPIARQHQLVITHAGDSSAVTEAEPISAVDTRSDAMTGYLLEESLRRALPDLDLAVVLTCSLVDRADPAFEAPTTPVGPVYDRDAAATLTRERGFTMVPAAGGFRRVVPSPEPIGVLQRRALTTLVEAAMTVVASSDGTVPVVLDSAGRPWGTDGVVDADLAAVALAYAVNADALVLLTDVDGVSRDGITSASIRRLSTDDVRRMIDGADLSPGTMAPKLEAARRFAETGGYSVIASLDDAEPALRRAAGTRVYKAVQPERPAVGQGVGSGRSHGRSG